jgi:hypothetical protein
MLNLNLDRVVQSAGLELDCMKMAADAERYLSS